MPFRAGSLYKDTIYPGIIFNVSIIIYIYIRAFLYIYIISYNIVCTCIERALMRYAMVGHSGSGPEAENLVPWGKPPRSPQEQLAIVKQMAAHAPPGVNGLSDLAMRSQVHGTHTHIYYTISYTHIYIDIPVDIVVTTYVCIYDI